MFKWLISTIVIALAATGCSTALRNETSPSPQNNSRVNIQQTDARRQPVKSSTEIAAHLEQLAKRIHGVKDAHCVVVGNKAVVGIDVDGSMERSQVGTIKYSVAEAFRNDPYGVDALVTADIDIAHRLQEMGADVRNGRPIAGFAEEMADIMGRIVPQVPRSIEPRDTHFHNAPLNDKKP